MKFLIYATSLLSLFAIVSAKPTRKTKPPVSESPEPVDLGTAGNYAILTKTGVTTTGVTHITGDIGASPIAAGALTGFGLTLSTDGTYATSALVTGKLYAADYAPPTPTVLTTAVADMATAYTDAAGRDQNPILNLFSGNLEGQVLQPALYAFGSTVKWDNVVYLDGGRDDVWIFQIAGGLTIGADSRVVLQGRAQAKNVFWQVAGVTAVGARAHVEGVILGKKKITFNSGSSLNGAALTQTQCTMIATTIVADTGARRNLRG